jgi:hypothetical protein
MDVRRYSPESHKDAWNAFTAKAENSTFLFNRNFMDYHSDRFVDFSLMVYDDKETLIACFPANKSGENEITSHQGLTYGSFILSPQLKLPVQLKIFSAILKFYGEQGIDYLKYKAFPRFYNPAQTNEIEYALFLVEAELIRRDTAIAVDRENRIAYSGNVRREAKKAAKNGCLIEEVFDVYPFWEDILTPNLQERFGANPVHSSDEIALLKEKFPRNIRLFVAKDSKGGICAGTLLFITDTVAHTQYISATDEGRRSGALNLLFTQLLDYEFVSKRYFDFGTANENEGKEVNAGLLAWKERMGGRAYSHDFFDIQTKNHKLLNP